MRRKIFITIFLLVSTVGTYASIGKQFEIKRGINLSHWLSQRGDFCPPMEEGMHEADFMQISRDGFDHVRLPVDEEVLWQENGEKNATAFACLHNGIRWALQNDLRVIVDLHIVKSHYFNAGFEGKQNRLWSDMSEQEHFMQLWKDLSQELRQYPVAGLAYEIMNEPTAPSHDDWNKLIQKVYNVIRTSEKERVIVIGSNMWQGVDTFKYLEVPRGDSNILLSCHFYEPFLLSHYRASWTEFGNYAGGVHYPGYLVSKEEYQMLSEADKKIATRWLFPWNKETLASFLIKAKTVADEMGLNLYCGEFGIYEKAPQEEALRWYTDVIDVFDRMNIAWAKWDYKGGFGIYTAEGRPKEQLIETLMSGSDKKIVIGMPVYLDDSKPVEQRIADALSRMTLAEKVRLSYADGRFSTPGCPRLGIPGLMYSDGPHGVRAEICWNSWDYAGWTNDSCTAFPALTCLASTWNTSLSEDYGQAIGEEALFRNKNVLLGPGVNIYRTPLNGRNFEYMGEDPYLAARMCVPYIKGVQQNGVAACVKHYALNNQELWRNHIDVHVSDRALYEIYLPAFKAAVEEGHSWTIMGAYNKVRGMHAAHNKLLNNDILKGEWNYDGCVVTDWGAAHDTYEAAMYGLDLELGTYTNGLTTNSNQGYDAYYLGSAYLKMIEEGKIPMEVVNDKAARVLRLIFRTSMNREKGFGVMSNEKHYATAYNIATEGIVLLKNEKKFGGKALLPVQPGQYKKILVVGDNAVRNLMMGGGSSELKPKMIITPLEALQQEFGIGCIEFAQGYMAGRPMYDRDEPVEKAVMDSLYSEAVTAAKNADLVIFMGGLNKNFQQDCEGNDRLSFQLPYGQDRLINGILEVNKKMVLVLTSGNAVDMPWLDKVPALVQSWYLGSIGGKALADVISGKVNPSGKLPFTYPAKLEDCPAHYYGEISYPGDSIRQEYKEDILVGYRWYDTKKISPLFPFGYGLSYTQFKYSKPQISAKELMGEDTVEVKCTVKNIGSVAGKEIVQLYIGDEACSVLRPVKELKDFQKITLQVGEEKEVCFRINKKALMFFDDKAHDWVVEPGKFRLYIGGSSLDTKNIVDFVYKE